MAGTFKAPELTDSALLLSARVALSKEIQALRR
jgi:hypothetical protein